MRASKARGWPTPRRAPRTVNQYGRIKLGTRVRVDFVPNDVSATADYVIGTLMGRPSDVGDTFRLLLDDGTPFEFNPNCSAFQCIGQTLE